MFFLLLSVLELGTLSGATFMIVLGVKPYSKSAFNIFYSSLN